VRPRPPAKNIATAGARRTNAMSAAAIAIAIPIGGPNKSTQSANPRPPANPPTIRAHSGSSA